MMSASSYIINQKTKLSQKYVLNSNGSGPEGPHATSINCGEGVYPSCPSTSSSGLLLTRTTNSIGEAVPIRIASPGSQNPHQSHQYSQSAKEGLALGDSTLLIKTQSEKLFPKKESSKYQLDPMTSNILSSNQKNDALVSENPKQSSAQRKERNLYSMQQEPMYYLTPHSEPSIFTHNSKFFLLEHPIQLIQQYSLNLKKKRSGAPQGIMGNNTLQNPIQQKIPMIQEWFAQLSIEDRILALTIVEQIFVDAIIEMQTKITKKGQGRFKLVTSIVQQSVQANGNEPAELQPTIKYDFQFTSIRSFLQTQKDMFAQQNKQIPEKELLDHIRVTTTKLSNHPAKGSAFASVLNKDDLNTITVTSALVQNPQKFFELMHAIVGQNFLKIPLEIDWDEHRETFVTKTPIWFNPYQNNSLAAWIIFYLEIALWIHYNAYVKSLFRITKEQLNPKIFIQKESQLINARNELKEQWTRIIEESKSNQSLLKEIGQKILTRTMQTNERISQLNGGLLQLGSQQSEQSIEKQMIQDNQIIEALIKNQDPHLFMQELCMTSLQKLNSNYYMKMERALVDILRDRLSNPKGSVASLEGMSKSDKKKLKKKQKKKAKRTNGAHTLQNVQSDSHSEKNEDEAELGSESQDNQIEEEKELFPQLQESEESESDFDVEVYDFNSNAAILQSNDQILSRQRSGEKRNRDHINLLLDELMKEEVPQIQVLAQLTPIYEEVKYEIESQEEDDSIKLESSKIEDNTVAIEEINERNSESTEDIQDNLPQIENSIVPSSDRKDSIVSSSEVIDYNNCLSTPFSAQDSVTPLKQEQSVSTEKRYKVKGASAQSTFKNTFNRVSHEPSIDEPEDKFTIIRSSKSFVPSNSSQKQNINLDKKRKKKRSKAVGPPVLQTNSTQKTQLLNNFMKNMINDEQEGQQQNKKEIIRGNKKTALDEADTITKKVYVRKSEQQIENELEKSTDKPERKNSNKQLKTSPPTDNQCEKKTPGRFENFINGNDQTDFFNKKQTPQQNNFNSERQQSKHESKKKKGGSNKNKSKNQWGNKTQNKRQLNNQASLDYQYNIYENQSFPNLNLGNLAIPPRSMNSYDGQYQPLGNDFMNQSVDPNNIQYISQLLEQALKSSSFNQQLNFNEPVQNNFGPSFNTYPDQVNQEEAHEDMVTEQFFEMINSQIHKMVKDTERKLESVRKERECAITIIEGIVKETFNKPHYFNQFVSVKMYGSMASGLAIEQSDVDLAVVGLDCRGLKDLQIQQMRKLYDQLDQFMKSKSQLQLIETASVPVIKLQIDLQKIVKKLQIKEKNSIGQTYENQIDESMRYLGIDITFEDSSKQPFFTNYNDGSKINLGIQCINYIKQLCMELPYLKPIVLVLKKLLQEHNLNQPYHGGLNSYSLVLMAAAFLKMFNDVESMSKNLAEFLNYFGSFFDPSTTIIDNLQMIKVGPLLEPMTIIDPLNKGNNTTRSAFRIKEIQQIFKEAYAKLTECQHSFKESQSEMDVIRIITDNGSSTPAHFY